VFPTLAIILPKKRLKFEKESKWPKYYSEFLGQNTVCIFVNSLPFSKVGNPVYKK